MAEPIFMKLGMYVMVPKPISTVYFINLSHQSVCLYVYLAIVARQRLGKNVTAATIEEMLDASFSVRSMTYQTKQAFSSFQNFLFENVICLHQTIYFQFRQRMSQVLQVCLDSHESFSASQSFYVPLR
jgi:hypothetical protein